jgi:riboflavin synthase
MFTGLVETTGEICDWRPQKSGGRLVLKSQKNLGRVRLGESLAVNGCCLTVVKNSTHGLEFDVSDETMSKTALGDYGLGDTVNLERALSLGDRLGGHLMQGHVDTTGRLVAVKKQKGSVQFTFSYPKKFYSLVIEKGSIAVDGISLTACDLTRNQFSVYIIPHTLKLTHLNFLKPGDAVNIEFDMVGKYVLRGSC